MKLHWLALTVMLLTSRMAAADCTYDRDKLLALDFKSFDQDFNGGWRGLGPNCHAEASDLLHIYREAHKGVLAEKEYTLLSWHEGQIRAVMGDTPGAIPLLSAWLEDPEPAIRDYAAATIAFLNHDRAGLRAARAKLFAEPKPDWFDKQKFIVGWPMNLGVVDGLIGCFGQSYAASYGSDQCIAAGEKMMATNSTRPR